MDDLEQSDLQTPQPSFKRKYFFILAALFIVIGIGAFSYVVLIRQDDSFPQPATTETTSSDSTDSERSILVLLETYAYNEGRGTSSIYSVPLNGSGEKEVSASAFDNEYGLARLELGLPSVSRDRKYLAFEGGEGYLLINSQTGEKRTLLGNHPGFYSDHHCSWSHKNTKIACIMRDGDSSILSVVDIESGDETVFNDSSLALLSDEFSISWLNQLLGWDKDDKSILLFGTELKTQAGFLFMVDLESKSVTSLKIGDVDLGGSRVVYSAQLNKLVYAADEALLSVFDIGSRQSTGIYQHSDHFITEDAAVVKGSANFLGSNLVFYHPQENVIVVENSYFFGENLNELLSGVPEERQGEKSGETILYAYNLETQDVIKIFSRSNTDYPNSEFQFGVIP
ncbi:MAG TPA: hypothetical protein VGA53_05190 [Candidatus Paceibacterota bacterium]